MVSAVIVEDEVFVAKFLETILKKFDFNVVCILNKFDNAIEKILDIKPNVVFLDINLGTQDTKTAGIDIANAIKDVDIRIIFLTAYTNDIIINKALKITPENYITKPFTIDSLKIPLQILKNKINIIREDKKFFTICDNAFFYPSQKFVILSDNKVYLTNTELQLLNLLCFRANSILTHEAISEYIWPHKYVSNTTLRELLSRLRKKIPCINVKNHSGVGYELCF